MGFNSAFKGLNVFVRIQEKLQHTVDHDILYHYYMGGACGAYGGQKGRTQSFGGKT